MGPWRRWLLPRVFDVAMRGPEFSELRRRVAPEVRGTVLEVGFGSGLNLPHLAGPPDGVERLLALDPVRAGRRLARARIAAAPFPVEFVDAAAGELPLDAGSVDAVLSTWTLCAVPDPARFLAELARVLRPGGTLAFVEHGASPDPAVLRRQRRLSPLNRLVFGCRLDVPVGDVVRAAGFELARLDTYAFAKVGRTAGWTYEGVARR